MLKHIDFAVLGSGFGGSLLAQILAAQGRSVVMIDKHHHPRFAIGESSTPLADTTLERIAQTWNLPRLKPLTRYGTWKTTYPRLTCGLKRGFTYLAEQPTSAPGVSAIQRLQVAASSRDEVSDTQWLRADVDAFFCEEARTAGVDVIEDCRYNLRPDETGWSLVTTDGSEHRQSFHASFVVDATGTSRAMLQLMNVPDRSEELRTHSSAIYAHFENVKRSDAVLRRRGVDVDEFLFRSDDAALHVLLPDGWMWQLRFDDETVSVGILTDHRFQRREPAASGLCPPPGEQWQSRIRASAFLSEQFADARIIRPRNVLVSTARLQRLAASAGGGNWAALPGTVGFIDPLHSTGIAHTLSGVERLAAILLSDTANDRSEELRQYSDSVIAELRFVDQLVEGCYAALPHFELFCDWSMLYFAAVTGAEQHSAPDGRPRRFLIPEDPAFHAMLQPARQRLAAAANDGSMAAFRAFRDWLRREITPWNFVGLLDNAENGLYAATAAR